jgi:hypothetical protein
MKISLKLFSILLYLLAYNGMAQTNIKSIETSKIGEKVPFGKTGNYFKISIQGNDYSYKDGIIDSDGNFILPSIYTHIKELCTGKILVTIDRKDGLLDANFKTILPLHYEDIKILKNPDYYLVNSYNGRIINRAGIPIMAEEQFLFQASRDYFCKNSSDKKLDYFIITNEENYKKGIFDLSKKEIVVPIDNDYIEETSYGFISIKGEKKYNYYDNSLKKMFADDQEFIKSLPIPFLIVTNDAKFGICRVDGSYISSSDYTQVEYLYSSKQFFLVSKGNESGVLDSSGKLILPIVYTSFKAQYNGIIKVQKNEKWGIIDDSLKEILPILYDALWITSHKIVAKAKNKFIVMDVKTHLLEDYKYDNIQEMDGASGYFLVKNGNKVGLLNSFINEIIPIKYTDIEPLRFYEPLFVVEMDKKFGLADKIGNLITTVQYEKIIPIHKSKKIIVKKDGKFGVLSATGSLLEACIYESIEPNPNNSKQYIGIVGSKMVNINFD